MKQLILIAATLCLGGCSVAGGAAKEEAPSSAPTYQMRAEEPAGDRMAAGRNGAALFSRHCGYCHLAAGMGTNILTKQQVAAGQPPELGLLVNRDDLSADYVKAVVRMGKGAMPRQTRVDVTDPELDAIAAFLAKGES